MCRRLPVPCYSHPAMLLVLFSLSPAPSNKCCVLQKSEQTPLQRASDCLHTVTLQRSFLTPPQSLSSKSESPAIASEISQTEKDKYCLILFICGNLKKTNKQTKVELIVAESETVITRNWGNGEAMGRCGSKGTHLQLCRMTE